MSYLLDGASRVTDSLTKVRGKLHLITIMFFFSLFDTQTDEGTDFSTLIVNIYSKQDQKPPYPIVEKNVYLDTKSMKMVSGIPYSADKVWKNFSRKCFTCIERHSCNVYMLPLILLQSFGESQL